MNEIGMNELLTQLRALSARAQGAGPAAAQAPVQESFQSLLKGSIDSVNKSQINAEQLTRAFEVGDPNADLASVMIAMQKANLSFQTMVQVRNKLVTAYQDVMNMPV